MASYTVRHARKEGMLQHHAMTWLRSLRLLTQQY